MSADADGPRYARVAPPVPVPGLFSYLIPEALRGRVVPGVRVSVPFGGRRLTAMVVDLDDGPLPDGVSARPLAGLLEDEPLVGPDILALGQWIAAETCCSVGEALDAALPRAVKRGHRGRTVEEARLALPEAALKEVLDALQEKRPKQARTLRILADRGGALPVTELMNLAHVSRSPVQSLARAGHVTLGRKVVDHDPLTTDPVPPGRPHELTADQAAVTGRIVELARARGEQGRVVLLHGVTGSGKTEVYLQALAEVVADGRQGIVLVPEISLTPQTVKRFRERFERVAVLHSHLTDAERNDQWRRIRRGEADVVVGARSAIFAPLPDLGLVVIDEEHETSFKQNNVPRYHAREVAVERARLAGAVVVLGTATPSLESWHRAQTGQYEKLVLPERVAGGRVPEVVLVDLTVEQRRKGYTYLSDPLRAAMEDAFAREGQVILFLNRRGWATVLMCRSCREALKCPHCEVSLTMHKRIQRVLCHYCGHEQPPPQTCPTCRSRLQPLGFGTEKVEQEVRQAFPGLGVARMDSDTMSGRGAHAEVLEAFGAGKVQVLVGTQMIAKGLDFPNALVVGVICADSALFLPDYRAAERTFQLLAQVTGRTGRGPKGGRVVVQAYDTRHPAIRAGVAQDQETFARGELPNRDALLYPPYGRLVRVVAQGKDEDAVKARLAAMARLLVTGSEADPAEAARERAEREAAAARVAEEQPGLFGPPDGPAPGVVEGLDGPAPDPAHLPPLDRLGPSGPLAAHLAEERLMLLGPAQAPIPRLNDLFRWHLVAKCEGDGVVDDLLAVLADQAGQTKGVRVLIDVDPLAML